MSEDVALVPEFNPDHLHKWIRLYKQELQDIDSTVNDITPEQLEIQKIKEKIKCLETGKGILKQIVMLMS
ncbi:hypothetical protein CVX30_003546 [Salmonella enterica subsp. enterica serovar Javiana]|nr:hypothetical protein [Salmonella enterica]EEE2429324.1 hypothetical protein [Salmonella enterica subsp. enterica serovar Javiana]EER6426825.1 hypothetical protein [Escherichia coli]EMC4064463.1 hypothetical protein [Salmonella enterica subsp. enterica serovar Muenster]EAZ8970671.1 hypothetical protein [Salmonella enterica]